MSLIIGLFTQVLSPGGVQRASRHVAAVTAAFAADRGISCRFLSLNDPQGLHSVRVGSSEFSVTGHARDKAQFVLAALRSAGRKPVLVIALHPHLAPIVWAMRMRSRKFRSIVFAHGIEVWQPLGWLRRAALRRADLVIGPSEDTVRHLISTQGIRAEKVQRLPWGLDPEFEARLAARVPPPLPSGFPRDGKIILTVGRWDPAERYKGADTLISALPRVLQAAPDAYLVLVGDGADRPRLEQLARDLGVSERTRFLPGLTQDETLRLLRGLHSIRPSQPRRRLWPCVSGSDGSWQAGDRRRARRHAGRDRRWRHRLACAARRYRAALRRFRIPFSRCGASRGDGCKGTSTASSANFPSNSFKAG